ncbi:MAG: ornithine cyclodeaminase family protein, partial [Clostridiaceae bacterium]|nr:ornithine cyclodeaminase family protein [Clostridiaceae bacterium]
MNFEADHNFIGKKIKIGRELLYLTKEDVIEIGLKEQDILKLTENALIAHGKKEYEMPAKIGVHPYEEVFFHAM